MYVLDTDTLSLFFHHSNQQPHLVQRILSVRPEDLWITIITVDEQLSGARRIIDDPKRPDGGMNGCRLLRKIMGDLAQFQILPYDPAAKQIFTAMSAASKRVGRNDAKIAAIAISRGFTVITRNVQHYREIGTVKYEDWAVKP